MALAELYGSPLDAARQMLGKTEGADAAAIQDYLQTGGANLDPATQAWCAAFVNASLGQAGIQGTGQMNAKSFMDWGQPVDQPMPGDVAVFNRGDPGGWQGHVGLFEGIGPDGQIQVLGGNQGNSVSVAGFDPSSLLGFRRAPGAQQPMGTPFAPGGTDLASMFSQPSAAPTVDPVAAQAAAERKRREALFSGLPDLYT